MKSFQSYYLLTIIFLSLTRTSIAAPKYAKPGCKDMCGNVRIPYPFGIGASCSINKWYSVDCNSSTPYLSALNHLQVVGVDLGNQTVTVNTPTTIFSNCQNPVLNTNSINLGGSPFLFSKSHNIFVVEGCGNAVMTDHDGSALSGCSTNCFNDSIVSDKSNCLGITCCQTTIPYYLKSYNVNLTLLDGQGGVGTCGSAFLVDKNSYDQGRFSDPFLVRNYSSIPISLLWTLTDHDQASCCRLMFDSVIRKVDIGNGTAMNTWKCSPTYWPMEGTPYLEDGCEVMEECARCTDGGGYCDYGEIFDIDGLFKEWNFTCATSDYFNSHFGITNYEWLLIIGILLTSGLGFMAVIYVSYRLIKKRIVRYARSL